MKLTKEKLKQIIKEEASKALEETGTPWDDGRDELFNVILASVKSALEAVRFDYAEQMDAKGIDFNEVVNHAVGAFK